MGQLVRNAVPKALEVKLKASRLDLLALFRAIDSLEMDARELPPVLLNELFELDADFAQALCALDEPLGSIDVRAMLSDTRRSLADLDRTRMYFLESLIPGRRAPLEKWIRKIRPTLTQDDAYHAIPGKDPTAGEPSAGGPRG